MKNKHLLLKFHTNTNFFVLNLFVCVSLTSNKNNLCNSSQIEVCYLGCRDASSVNLLDKFILSL